MSEMKLQYVREADQYLTVGKSLLCAIEIQDREDARVLIDSICHNEDERMIYFEGYNYYKAYRYHGNTPEAFRLLELTLSTPIDNPAQVVNNYLHELIQ